MLSSSSRSPRSLVWITSFARVQRPVRKGLYPTPTNIVPYSSFSAWAFFAHSTRISPDVNGKWESWDNESRPIIGRSSQRLIVHRQLRVRVHNMLLFRSFRRGLVFRSHIICECSPSTLPTHRPAKTLLPASWRCSKILLEIGSFWGNNAGGSNYFQSTTFNNIHF